MTNNFEITRIGRKLSTSVGGFAGKGSVFGVINLIELEWSHVRESGVFTLYGTVKINTNGHIKILGLRGELLADFNLLKFESYTHFGAGSLEKDEGWPAVSVGINISKGGFSVASALNLFCIPEPLPEGHCDDEILVDKYEIWPDGSVTVEEVKEPSVNSFLAFICPFNEVFEQFWFDRETPNVRSWMLKGMYKNNVELVRAVPDNSYRSVVTKVLDHTQVNILSQDGYEIRVFPSSVFKH